MKFPIHELVLIGEGIADPDLQKVFLVIWGEDKYLYRSEIKTGLEERGVEVKDLEETLSLGAKTLLFSQRMWEEEQKGEWTKIGISPVGRLIFQAVMVGNENTDKAKKIYELIKNNMTWLRYWRNNKTKDRIVREIMLLLNSIDFGEIK